MGPQTCKLQGKVQGRRAHSAASVVLVVTDKDIPLRLLVQLRWRADDHRPQQAVQLILSPELCQEDISRCVMLLEWW